MAQNLLAQNFLAQLPWASSDKLPVGAECMICQEKYGTFPSDNGILEHAVVLPCTHQVGSECIAVWLSTGNSCPMCRKVFFPAHQGEDYDEDDDESEEGDISESEEEESSDDDESEETTTKNLASVLRMVGWSLVTFRTEEEYGQDDEKWYDRWLLPTAQEYQNSEDRARQALLRPPPTGLLLRPIQAYSPPADLESEVRQLSSAYRTLAFRETLLYLAFQCSGARMPRLACPYKGLSPNHETHLLWELGQRGAFGDALSRPKDVALTNRQAWFVHRAKGEVYTYEKGTRRGYWSTKVELGGLFELDPRMCEVLNRGFTN